MQVVKVPDPRNFLERAAPLLADEARHNLILGLAGTLRDNPALYRDHELWLVEDDGAVAGAALRTPPYNLVLSDGRDEALDALARKVGGAIPGAVGAVPEIDRFVAACVAAHGVTPEPHVRQGIYALETVVPPPTPPGSPRAATAVDRRLLVRWWGAFGAEALGALEQDEEDDARNVEHRLSTPGNGIALWEVDGRPVCAVGYGSPTPTGVRIGPVYTPPEHRGHGYGSAVTARAAFDIIDSGALPVLYAEVGNATSNKIYQAIGFRPVTDRLSVTY